jgi:prolyl-tRNA synthetase
VFRLQYVYTDAMDVNVQGAGGEAIRPTMGCYGIGVERILAASVEAHHDDAGIAWPASIAPYDVLMVGIGLDRDEDARVDADRLYADLQHAGLEVIFDDRDERPGVKFNDADLIGIPIRLTVSSRNHKAGVVEVKVRDGNGEAESVERAEVVARVQAVREGLLGRLTVEAVERLARVRPETPAG